MEQYEMPEFAVVGATVYAESAYGSFESKPRKGKIVKVLKTSVDFELEVNGTVERYTIKAWTSTLSLKGFQSARHGAPRLLSEEKGLERIARIDHGIAIRTARYRIENVSSELSKRSRNAGLESLDALMNELKTSMEELRELHKD